jgi:K+/H+ antiporter YhaU regulatory subunit KhtT
VQLISNSYEKYCSSVLKLDASIRFVGKIMNRQLVSSVRREKVAPLLDEEGANMAHYQVSIHAMMDEMFDKELGKTNFILTSREKVNLITILQDDGFLILSIDPLGNYVEIIEKIKNTVLPSKGTFEI